MEQVFNRNYTITTTYDENDFNEFSFLKKRLMGVYVFIKSRHFSHDAMKREKEIVMSSSTFEKLKNEYQVYICRFYDIAIRRLKKKFLA